MGGVTAWHQRAHELFNRRDWEGLRAIAEPDLSYEDHARSLTLKGDDQFIGWLQGWQTMASDAKPSNQTYLEAGDTSIALFVGTGTNDGPMGQYPATGQRFAIPFCEVLRWTEHGTVARGEIYYDAMTLLVQLGLMQPPPQP